VKLITREWFCFWEGLYFQNHGFRDCEVGSDRSDCAEMGYFLHSWTQ